MGRGDDKQEVFARDGPKHMIGIEIDWKNEEHQRCIAACLVKGTYIMERDRVRGDENTPSARARAWWESFHFHHRCDYNLDLSCGLECVLCYTKQLLHGTIPTRSYKDVVYGAVLEYAPPPDAAVAHRESAPSYIVAFRGTMRREPTGPSDMRNNFRILANKQHSCRRFNDAREVVERLLRESAGSSGGVWLAGHSLGASIALDVGRHMMINKGFNLPAFLFNPPHVSLLPVIGEERSEVVYTVGDIGRWLLGGGVFPHHKKRMEELFKMLALWVPNLYVNPKDTICAGFIAYFKKREQQHPRWASATYLSYRDMLFRRKSERPHLLPSAKLWENQSHDAHGLSQWWQPQGSEEPVLSPKTYTWP